MIYLGKECMISFHLLIKKIFNSESMLILNQAEVMI